MSSPYRLNRSTHCELIVKRAWGAGDEVSTHSKFIREELRTTET